MPTSFLYVLSHPLLFFFHYLHTVRAPHKEAYDQINLGNYICQVPLGHRNAEQDVGGSEKFYGKNLATLFNRALPTAI